jgi:ferric-dicitrate binding protein FerR (iron transport regulator)
LSPNDSRLDALQRYVDGMATRDDVAAVERAILDDAQFRKLAVEYLHLDSAMEEFAVVRDVAPAVMPVRRLRWALAAAVAVIGLALWHWWPVKPSGAHVGVAQVEIEVVQLVDAKVAGPNGGMRIHDRVRLDSLDLLGGEAQFRLPSDVNLFVSGPAELRFIDPMHARVLHGKVTVDCGERGKGFVLDTPVTRVVDVSTQFVVEARADGATDVLVIKGNVELFNPQQTLRAAPLEEGEAVRVDAKQAIKRIVNITGGTQPGEWSTRPPPRDCNITSVSDNFGSAEGFHFYRTVPHGLKPGAVVYTNRPHVWNAVDGKDFPKSLVNADVVQTFFGELTRPGYAIDIVVARPVELFVLMPRRGIPPPWLAENFTRTGEEILMEEKSPDVHSHVFDVWKRTVLQAGKVTLGPGNRDAGGRPTGMYGIAAKGLSP